MRIWRNVFPGIQPEERNVCEKKILHGNIPSIEICASERPSNSIPVVSFYLLVSIIEVGQKEFEISHIDTDVTLASLFLILPPRTLWEKGEKENQPSHVTWLCLSPCNRSQITLIAHSWSRAALSFRLGGFVIFSMISGSFLLLTRHKNVDSIPEVEKCRGVNLLFEAPVDPQVKKASQWYESNDLGSDTKIEGN